MDHFNGVTPQERYNNDLLSEIRRTNELLEKLVGRDAQTPNRESSNQTHPTAKRKYQKRGA